VSRKEEKRLIISIHDGAKSNLYLFIILKLEEGALSLQQKWEILAGNCEIGANSGS
jgi:hypothetical protein